MKNKEIEELLNTFKELINTYSPDTEPFTIDYDYEIKYSALESLLSYIEQLVKENDRLIAESTHYESKFYNEAKKVDKAIEYINKTIFNEKGYINFCYELESLLKGGSDD